jgi:hypothetical protein
LQVRTTAASVNGVTSSVDQPSPLPPTHVPTTHSSSSVHVCIHPDACRGSCRHRGAPRLASSPALLLLLTRCGMCVWCTQPVHMETPCSAVEILWRISSAPGSVSLSWLLSRAVSRRDCWLLCCCCMLGAESNEQGLCGVGLADGDGDRAGQSRAVVARSPGRLARWRYC